MLVVELACRPITMPSSLRPSSSTDQATRILKHSDSKDRHCQTVYDDGHSRCIVESRRRPRVVRGIDMEDSERPHAGFVMCGSMKGSSVQPSPYGLLSYPSLKASFPKSGGLTLSREKGLKPLLKSPKEVVIVPASSKSCASECEGKTSTSQIWIEPTPPPTPRLGLLPTPELPDLDEAPFCECDQAIVVRCCASCKKTVDFGVH